MPDSSNPQNLKYGDPGWKYWMESQDEYYRRLRDKQAVQPYGLAGSLVTNNPYYGKPEDYVWPGANLFGGQSPLSPVPSTPMQAQPPAPQAPSPQPIPTLSNAMSAQRSPSLDYNQFVSQYVNQRNPQTGLIWNVNDIAGSTGVPLDQINSWLGQAQTAGAVQAGGIPWNNAAEMAGDQGAVYSPGYQAGLQQALGMNQSAYGQRGLSSVPGLSRIAGPMGARRGAPAFDRSSPYSRFPTLSGVNHYAEPVNRSGYELWRPRY